MDQNPEVYSKNVVEANSKSLSQEKKLNYATVHEIYEHFSPETMMKKLEW